MKANSPTIVTITSLTLLSLNCFMNYTLLLSTSHLKWEKLTKIIAHKKYLLFRAQAYPLPRTDDRRLSCFSNNELPVAGWKESDKFALYTVVHGIFLQLSKKNAERKQQKKYEVVKWFMQMYVRIKFLFAALDMNEDDDCEPSAVRCICEMLRERLGWEDLFTAEV